MIRNLLILVIPLSFLLSCGDVLRRMPPTSIGFDTIEKGDYSHCDRFFKPTGVSVFILNNKNDFNMFCSMHRNGDFPPPDTPEVDFQAEDVIVALDRPENSGGYSVVIESLEASDEIVIINVTKVSPGGEGCLTTYMLTRPFHIIRTAKTDKEFTVFLTEKIWKCE